MPRPIAHKSHLVGPVALAVLVLAMAALLGFTRIGDVDAWTHLLIGKTLWAHKGYPALEPFLYTSAHRDFLHSYPFWFFALLSYLIYAAGGGLALSALQSALVTGAMALFYKDALGRRGLHSIAAPFMALGLALSFYRFVLRPELLVMLYLALTVHLLAAHLRDGHRGVYALPLLHMLWANTHSSVIVLLWIYPAFIVGALLHDRLIGMGLQQGGPYGSKVIRRIALLFPLSMALTLLNPTFAEPYFFGSRVMGDLWQAYEITELMPPEGAALWVIAAFDALVLLSFALCPRRVDWVRLLLVLPFLVLPLKAVRFQFIAALMGAPALALNVSAMVEARGWTGRARSMPTLAVSALMVVALGWTAYAGLIPPFDKTKRPGPGFDYSFMPRGGVDYMLRNGIEGRVFNSFQFGQYIAWEASPRLSVFIDGRFYVDQDQMRWSKSYWGEPQILDTLYARYGFESLLVEYLEGKAPAGVDTSFHHPGWALVYWDDISMLYVRRGGPYDGLIARDGYERVRPAQAPGVFIVGVRGASPEERGLMLAELGRAYEACGGCSRAALGLGLYHYALGDMGRAVAHLGEVRHQMRYPGLLHAARFYQAEACYAMGRMDRALEFYGLVIGDSPDNAHAVFRSGAIRYTSGDVRGGIGLMQRALALDGHMTYAYPELIAIYEREGMGPEAAALRGRQLEAEGSGRVRGLFEQGLAAYLGGDYGVAAGHFEEALRLDPGSPQILANLGHAYLGLGERGRAEGYFREALGRAPGHASALFGLGKLLVMDGRIEEGRGYLGEFLGTGPKGNLAREARELMAR